MSRRSPTPLPVWKLDEGIPMWMAEAEAEDGGITEWVHDHLSTLPDTEDQPHRSVVEMRIWGKYTFQEIADELGLNSRRNAHDLYNRAIDWLLNGRVIRIGKGDFQSTLTFPGMKDEAETWL